MLQKRSMEQSHSLLQWSDPKKKNTGGHKQHNCAINSKKHEQIHSHLVQICLSWQSIVNLMHKGNDRLRYFQRKKNLYPPSASPEKQNIPIPHTTETNQYILFVLPNHLTSYLGRDDLRMVARSSCSTTPPQQLLPRAKRFTEWMAS